MKRSFLLILSIFLLNHCSWHDRSEHPEKDASPFMEQHREKVNDGKPRQIETEDNPHGNIPSSTCITAVISKTDRDNPLPSNDLTTAANSSGRLFLLSKPKKDSDADLNEPVSREYFLAPVESRKFRSLISISRERLLRINFDNDILNYTDRFYTNGIRIEFISPAFQHYPLSKALMPYRRRGMNYYGMALVQNMYTPSTTKTGGILFGDRPYSAYLYLGTFKITNDPEKRFRQKSELDIGVIGSYSLGEYVQKSFHSEVPTNSVPLGWEYQIRNDLVLNYHVAFSKGVIAKKNIEMILNGTGSLGTLYTNLSGGFILRTGLMNPYFANLGVQKRRFNREQNLRDFQFLFFVTSRGIVAGYDATLEGGLLNRTSVYTINHRDIARAIFEGSAGITIVYRGIRFDIEQFLLSPEFHGGWWHKWVHMGFTFAI